MTRYLKAILLRLLGLNILKQEALLRLAMKEKGMNYKKHKIVIDHINGINYVNGVELPIIFPDSFFVNSEAMITKNKNVDFYFNGNMESTGGRKEMLSDFIDSKNSKVVESNYGRSPFNKYKFNHDYFLELAQAKYGLCPHQKDFVGNKDTMWTYRFIECCMVGTVPVVFTETPLGKMFLKGFYYENELIAKKVIIENDYQSLVEKNFELCKKRHRLSDKYLDSILNAA